MDLPATKSANVPCSDRPIFSGTGYENAPVLLKINPKIPILGHLSKTTPCRAGARILS
jgi:hypothetical protein